MAIPKHDPDVWLFDLDNTLYPAKCNLFAQIDVRIGRYISDWLKVDAEEARRVQKQYWRDHGTSMRGMMTLHGVDPVHYLNYVHDIDYSPIAANPALEKSLAALPGRKLIFTAGDVPHAEKVMERLGVAHHFEAIFDIVAGDYWPKPHQAIYDKLVVKHNVDPARAHRIDSATNTKIDCTARIPSVPSMKLCRLIDQTVASKATARITQANGAMPGNESAICDSASISGERRIAAATQCARKRHRAERPR